MAEPYIIRCEPSHAAWIHGVLLVNRNEMTFPVETLSLAEFTERIFDISTYFSYVVDGESKAILWLGPIEMYSRSAEFGVIATRRGEGHGQKATKMLLDYAFNTLGLHRMFCTVNASNARCLKSIEQFGILKHEGRLRAARFLNGRYEDQFTFSILATDPRG